MSSVSAFEKKLAKIEKGLKELKVSLKGPEKAPKKSAQKTTKIEDCKTKKELEKFKVEELKAWLSKNRVDTKKVTKKVKATWIKLVWENINGDDSDSSDSSSDSDDSDSSDSDSDSDSDESDSDSD